MATMNDQVKTLIALWVLLLVVLATMAQDAIKTRDPITDLDTVQTARRNGYPAESHTVQTADGCLLAVHRIPGGSHSRTSSRNRTPPSPGAATAAGAVAAARRRGAAASSPPAPWGATTTTTPSMTTKAAAAGGGSTISTTTTRRADTGRPLTAPEAARTSSAANIAAHRPPLLPIPMSTRWAPNSPRTTTTPATTCRICTPAPRLRALTTMTSAPSSTRLSAAQGSSGVVGVEAAWGSSSAAEAASESWGASASVEGVEVEGVGVEVEGVEVEGGRWSASAPTTPTTTTRTATKGTSDATATTETEIPTASETGSETEIETERGNARGRGRESETERGSETTAGDTTSSTATTQTSPSHRHTHSHPGSTDASTPMTLAPGMALRARMRGPHTLRIRRRRSVAPAANSSAAETSTTTTALTRTAAATRPAPTTATTTTTSAAAASPATPARASTRTWSTPWNPRPLHPRLPATHTPPQPPQPRTPSSTPSPSPRTTSRTPPPPPSQPPPSPPRTRSSQKSAASTAIDASSESHTDIPIGQRTQDTFTTTEGTTRTETSPTTTTTSYEGSTTTNPNGTTLVTSTTTTTTPDPPLKRKPVVFLQHGLMGSSYDWVLAGPGNGLAYLLADAGFDVWMGNARGNTYSRAHVYLPTKPSSPYWDFSFHEMAVYDLPAELEYILNVTGAPSVHYVGHSMGTTMFFAMAALKPEVAHRSVASMHALAPVAYVQHIIGPLRLLAPQVKRVQFLVHWLGLGEFLPQNFIIKWLTKWGCEKLKIEEEICENFMFVLCGFDKQQFNDSILPALLSHTPAGASTQTILHYAQMIVSGKFRQYDYGILDNRRKYGSDEPPPYDLSRVDVPVTLMYADNDWLATVEDVKRLYKSLECDKQMYRVPFKSFNHLDFILANDVKELVNDRILKDLLPRERESHENDVTANSVSLY